MRRVTTKKTSSPFEFFKKLRGKQDEKKPQKAQISERKGPSTMAFHFRNSLSDLVAKLQSANPHFVRCLKPNPAKTAMEFDTPYVLAQLRYTGILDIVKIRKFGYAMRLTFYEFLQRCVAQPSMVKKYEPVREKTNNLGSGQARHKPGCTGTRDC